MQTCDQTCSHCASDFFKWWKNREGQMSKPDKKQGPGVPPFMPQVTSSREKVVMTPDKMVVGTWVKWRNFQGVVERASRYRGADGHYYVGVLFSYANGYKTGNSWAWTVDAEECVCC